MLKFPWRPFFSLCLSLSCAHAGQPARHLYDSRDAVQDRELKKHLVYRERPVAPVSTRIHRKDVSGLYWLQFDKTGRVVAVKIVQSTTDKDFDNSVVYSLYRWRCRPGEVDQVIVPISFVANPYDAGIRDHLRN